MPLHTVAKISAAGTETTILPMFSAAPPFKKEFLIYLSPEVKRKLKHEHYKVPEDPIGHPGDGKGNQTVGKHPPDVGPVRHHHGNASRGRNHGITQASH